MTFLNILKKIDIGLYNYAYESKGEEYLKQLCLTEHAL